MFIADTADGVPVSYAEFQRIAQPFVAKNAWRFKPFKSVDVDDLLSDFLYKRGVEAIRTHEAARGKLANRLIAAVKWYLQDELKRLKRQSRRDDVGMGIELCKPLLAEDAEKAAAALHHKAQEEPLTTLAAVALELVKVEAKPSHKFAPKRFTRAQIGAMLVLKRHKKDSFRGIQNLAGSSDALGKKLRKKLGFRGVLPSRETLREASKSWANPDFIELTYRRCCKMTGIRVTKA
jgi:hypothetical protein